MSRERPKPLGPGELTPPVTSIGRTSDQSALRYRFIGGSKVAGPSKAVGSGAIKAALLFSSKML